MTSVPKPLKYMKNHYVGLKDYLVTRVKKGSEVYGLLADILSVLAMTSAESGSMETLKFKLESGVKDAASWGHEYTRHLAGEIGEEYSRRLGEGEQASVSDLMELVEEIVPWNMAHNAEPEAVDLCLEVDRLDLIETCIDQNNCSRACLYLQSCASYLPEPEDTNAFIAAFNSYLKVGFSTNALRVALRMGDVERMSTVMATVKDPLEKKQIAYILGDARVWINLSEGEAAIEDESLREELQSIMG